MGHFGEDMIDKSKPVVLCMLEEFPHCEDSVMVFCGNDCGRKVWVQPHHLDKQCVCAQCVAEWINNGESIGFAVLPEDIVKAIQEMRKRGNDKK